MISRSCRFDWDSPFFTAAITPPIVVTVAEAPAPERKKAADLAEVIIAGERDVDLAFALGALAERGFARVLAEGGPSLNGQLAAAGLLDELCLTLSPLLVGGEAKRILAGPDLGLPGGRARAGASDRSASRTGSCSSGTARSRQAVPQQSGRSPVPPALLPRATQTTRSSRMRGTG